MWFYRTFTAYRRKTRSLTAVAILSTIAYMFFKEKNGLSHQLDSDKRWINQPRIYSLVKAVIQTDARAKTNAVRNTPNIGSTDKQIQHKANMDHWPIEDRTKNGNISNLSHIIEKKNTDVQGTFKPVIEYQVKSLLGSDTKGLKLSGRSIRINSGDDIRIHRHSEKINERMDENITFDEYFDNFDLQSDKPYYEVGNRNEDVFKGEYARMSDYWKKVADEIGVDRKLYQNNFDVDKLLWKLQTSKILNISFLLHRPTIKWVLTLEGGQKALFKPDLNVKEKQHCKAGCEHPQYEIGGFAINRMLGLNTMPFTTGRTLDWFTEIQPIATKDFKRLFSVYYRYKGHTKVCVKWQCRSTFPAVYCFPDSQIYGSIMYWVNGDIVELQQYSFHKKRYSRYHPMYFGGSVVTKKTELLEIGDARLCDKFRKKPPYDDIYHFLYILDIAVEDFLTQSKNSKHNILYLNSSNTTKVNVVIDKGKGFCPYDNDLLLAPIYQCCAIRKSVYHALEKVEKRFSEVFKQMTSLEKNIFTKDQLDGIEARVIVILDYVNKCIQLKGRENVLIGT